MKTKLQTLNIIVALAFFFSWVQMGSAQTLEEQNQYEVSVKNKLTEKVKLVIDEKLFNIVVNAKLDKVREKVILEGETSSQLDGIQQKKAELEKSLPGFQALDEGKKDGADDKVKSANSSKFKYNEYLKLSTLNVHLLMDQSIPADQRTLVETIVQQDLDSSYGKVAKLEVKELVFVEKKVPVDEAIGNWFTRYIEARGGSAIDLAYIGGALLLFLLGVLGLVRKLKQIQARNARSAETGATVQPDDTEANELAIETVLNKIVSYGSTHPLEVSCFLKQLNPESKKIILSAAKTPAINAYFQQLMNFYAKVPEGDNLAAISKGLTYIENDLERFVTIQEKIVTQQFGYLPLLTEAQLANFIDSVGEAARPRLVVMLAKYLSRPQLQALTEKLSVNDKVEVFKHIQTAKFSQQELDVLDAQLRKEYERIKENYSVLVTDIQEVEKEMLENDDQVTEVIQKLVAEKYPLNPSYEKYLVTWEKLVAFEKDSLSVLLQKIPNETVAKAFLRQPMSPTLKESLGEMRGKLVDSLKSHYHHVKPEEVQKAQTEILKTYWASLS